MSDFEIIEVESKSDLENFVRFPFSLYSKNPFWVPTLIKEDIDHFNFLREGFGNKISINFFLARQSKKIVGRIAAIINWIEVNKVKKRNVRFGWFDVIDNVKVTRLLLEKVEEIGRSNDLEFIEGPMGFSTMDKAGMLIEGFDEKNTMITWYNSPYYSDHLKKIGYSIQTQWVEYEIQLSSFDESPEKVKRISDLILNRYKLKVLNFNNRSEIIPYADEMFDLVGKTYDKLQTFVPIQKEEVDYYKKKYLKYVNPNFIKCIINEKGELIAFTVIMPSFSSALKKANGRLYPLGFLHLLKSLYFNSKGSFYLIGVHPKFQNKGVAAIIFNEVQKIFNKKNYKIVETNPELIENTKIRNMWRNYKHRQHKKRATFKKKISI
ncbi:MAG: GNAT family N-acetyltransferase [Flavobacteriaceae bacterium]|jgi:hypothetical protein|nr:GNAT family N-acetyltransferase [Flavobacteriaceae bacterium]